MTATLGSYVLEALRLEDTTDPLESTLYCTECSIPDLLSKCRAPIEWIRVGGSDDVCFDDVSDSLLQQTKVYHAHSLRQAIEVVLTLKEVPATLILDIGPEVEGNDVMVAQTRTWMLACCWIDHAHCSLSRDFSGLGSTGWSSDVVGTLSERSGTGSQVV